MKYINQAPKDWDSQSAKWKKANPDINDLPPYRWKPQPKYDGVFAMVSTTSKVAQSRQSELLPSAQHLVEACVKAFGPGYMVFMELYKFGEAHKTINGMARRQTVQPELQGIILDVVKLEEFQAGCSQDAYWWRRDQAVLALCNLPTDCGLFVVDELDDTGGLDLSFDDTYQQLAIKLKECTENAYDGLILRDYDAPWSNGACKNGECLKVKPALSLDLLVVGQFADKRATKLGGYLTVEYNGVPSAVGSGLTQEVLQNIVNDRAALAASVDARIPWNPRYVGAVAEVECLGLTPDGKLREPRLKGIRWDTTREEDK